MSACGSPLSSNRRIEPAVAVKAGVRRGISRLCLVVESGGNLCCSAVACEAGGVLARPPPPFWADGAADAAGGAGGAASARTAVQAKQPMIASAVIAIELRRNA